MSKNNRSIRYLNSKQEGHKGLRGTVQADPRLSVLGVLTAPTFAREWLQSFLVLTEEQRESFIFRSHRYVWIKAEFLNCC